MNGAQRFSVEMIVPSIADLLPSNSDGEPAIYAHAWNSDDERAVHRFVAADDPAGWAHVCIRKALDERGNRIWHQGHLAYLQMLPVDTLREIAMTIMSGSPDAADWGAVRRRGEALSG